jgi:hypothetical protein
MLSGFEPRDFQDTFHEKLGGSVSNSIHLLFIKTYFKNDWFLNNLKNFLVPMYLDYGKFMIIYEHKNFKKHYLH